MKYTSFIWKNKTKNKRKSKQNKQRLKQALNAYFYFVVKARLDF